eukprot:6259351-Pyramimonas_sp.AAC.1
MNHPSFDDVQLGPCQLGALARPRAWLAGAVRACVVSRACVTVLRLCARIRGGRACVLMAARLKASRADSRLPVFPLELR